MEPITVREARPDDRAWIDACYREVGFVPSDWGRVQQVVAEIGGERVGTGRVVRLDPENAELGGMYVRLEARGRGVAAAIVRSLLAARDPAARLFCLPFAHLRDFYGSFGFEPSGDVPAEIVAKHAWCNATYPHETLLLELVRDAAGTGRSGRPGCTG
jgi:GNAT superfamily N-acetyltransferase